MSTVIPSCLKKNKAGVKAATKIGKEGEGDVESRDAEANENNDENDEADATCEADYLVNGCRVCA